MRRFAADVMGVIATQRGRAAFAKPAKGLFFGDLYRQWAVVYGWKCNVFSRNFNIVSAFLVAEWMSGGKKSILARVVFGAKWGFVHSWLFAYLCCVKRNFMLNGCCLMRIPCCLRQNVLRFGAK